MDLATLIGLLVGCGAVIVGFLMEGGKLASLFEPSAAIIVFGGSIGATIVGFTLKRTASVPQVIKQAFFTKHMDPVKTINQIVSLAKHARQAGILGLESQLQEIDNAFLRRAMQMVVDGVQPEMVREVMEIEIDTMRQRHKHGEEFFVALGGYAPTLGVLGTVMGLVHMLETLDEPGKMGPAIATAFIATFYGVGTANLLFLPLAGKLRTQSREEIAVYEMAIEGVLSLQAGDNPRVVGMKMRSFLSPQHRRELEKAE